MGRTRRLLIMSVVLTVLVAVVASCSRPNSVIKAMRAEKIIDFTPVGLDDRGITEMPAGPIDQQNWIVRTFIAPDDENLLKACADYHQQALDEGWTGPEPSDPGSGGITATTLRKGDLELHISCVTTDSFDQFEHDEDAIRLSARISEK